MSYIKLHILFFLFILAVPLMAQEKQGFIPDFRLSQTTAISSGKDLPLWMAPNQNGMYTLHNPSYLLFQAGLSRSLERDTLKKWDGLTGTSDFQPADSESQSTVRYCNVTHASISK